MKKLHAEQITTVVAADAVIILDDEDTENLEQLQELNRKEAAKNTQNLKKEIVALKNSLKNISKNFQQNHTSNTGAVKKYGKKKRTTTATKTNA